MNAPDMRSVNGIQLLNRIREDGPLSRADLAKASQLSKPTVSEQVERLLALGVVIEVGQGAGSVSGGKKPTMLAFHAAGGRVAGIAIGSDITRVLLTDLSGVGTAETQIPTSANAAPLCRALLKLNSNSPGTIRAIGVGVPGRIDCARGVVLEAGNLTGWRNVHVATPLQVAFGCPVFVDNDVKMSLVAELNHGAAKGSTTAVLIRHDRGIGSAIAMNRRIHHGSHWAAGEIGHLAPVSPDLKRVSPRGQLEAVAGKDRIVKRVKSAARQSASLRALLKNHSELDAVFAAASARDTVALTITREISRYLSMAVAHQALAYDPDVLLLSGEVFPYVLDDIHKFISRTIPWSPKVSMADLGEEAVLLGAVDTALANVYDQMSRQLQHDGARPARYAAAG